MRTSDDIYIAVVVDDASKTLTLEVRNKNGTVTVGTFISEAHAMLFLDAFEQLLKNRNSKRLI